MNRKTRPTDFFVVRANMVSLMPLLLVAISAMCLPSAFSAPRNRENAAHMVSSVITGYSQAWYTHYGTLGERCYYEKVATAM